MKKSATALLILITVLLFLMYLPDRPHITTLNQQLQRPEIERSTHSLRLAWSDEFDKLSTDNWNLLNDSSGYANRKQHYTPNNIEVIDGYLNLHILQEDSHGFPYTSGAVTTRDKVNFMHGRLEIRAKLPKGKGFRPAIRMLPASGQSFPEINVAEIDGARPDELYNLAHQYADGKHEREYKKSSVEDISDDFHIYSIEWTEDSITYLLDNSELFTAKAIVPQEPMYLDLYVGVGGDWVQDPDHTTAFPNVMQVDYIRYYR